jgi:hypothetical protein
MNIKRRVFVFTLAICKLGIMNLGIANVVSALDGEWAALATITGFHDVTGPNSTFQLRVIEVNGRATVAINPITLYFVVTNDSSAGDLQQYVWRLPVSVARVQNISSVDSGVRIIAMLDAVPDADVKARHLQLIVHYALDNGKLKDVITVEQEAPLSK